MSKKIEAVESQIKSKIGTVESKIDAVENKIKSAVKTEVGAVESKILAQMSKLTSAVEALSQHYRDPVAALVATEVELRVFARLLPVQVCGGGAGPETCGTPFCCQRRAGWPLPRCEEVLVRVCVCFGMDGSAKGSERMIDPSKVYRRRLVPSTTSKSAQDLSWCAMRPVA
eukprot:1885900-Prymnesium_polylepis.2